MTDLLGPASAPNSTTTRPVLYRIFGALDTWFKPCSNPQSQDGTQIQADWLNGIMAQLRAAIRGNGNLSSGAGPVVPEVNTVDGLLLGAIQLLIARGQPNCGTDTGTADALAVGPATPWPEYVKGARIWVIKSSAAGPNATATPTLAVSNLTAVTIVRRDGSALLPGDLPGGAVFCAEYDGAYFRLVSLTWGEIASAAQSGKWLYGVATGVGNAATVTLFPSQAPVDGTEILVKWPGMNTAAAPTFLLTNFVVKTVVRQGGGQIQPGDLSGYVPLIYDATLAAWRVNGLVLSDISSVTKTRLSGATTFYVNSQTGSDTNPGTAAAPFLTIQAAVNYAQRNLDLNGYTVTFSCAGAFTAGVVVPGLFSGQTGPGSVVFAMGASAMVSVGSCFQAQNGAGFTITGTGTYSSTGTNAAAGQGWIINASGGSSVAYSGIVFGSATQSHIVTTADSNVTAAGNYGISGGAQAHISATGYSSVAITGVTITLSGTPAFSQAFVYAQYAFVGASAVTFNGSATGVRAIQDIGGYIFTNSASATYFPGNAAPQTVPFSVGQGGTGYVGGALTTYTPVFTPTSGSGVSFSINNADYLQFGKMLFLRVAFQVSFSSAPGGIIFNLPANLQAFATNVVTGVNLSNNYALIATMSGNGNVTVNKYDGSAPATTSGAYLVVEGWIETQ